VTARIALIVNPFATQVSVKRLAAVEEALATAGTVDVFETERPRHASELASATDHDAIVVFSGDGGFNEALNGLVRDVPIGFVPGGGTSVLPRALGLPREPVAAARQIATAISEGRARRVSLGTVNGRRFAFNAGIGLDAETVRRVEAARAPDGTRPGDLAVIGHVVKAILERYAYFPEVLSVSSQAETGRAAFVLVANATPYTFVKALSLKLVPEASFETGLDFVAATEVKPTRLPELLGWFLFGRLPRGMMLSGHDLDRIEVVCDRPLPLQADGEDLGDVTEAVFAAERDAVRVLV
jgi:diacylglycerol kinase family enzyme